MYKITKFLWYSFVLAACAEIINMHRESTLTSSIESNVKTPQEMLTEEESTVTDKTMESIRGQTIKDKVVSLDKSRDGTILRRLNEEEIEFTKHDITTQADGARTVFAIDLDGDGDIDVLSASDDDDTVAWYKNDGSETFTLHVIDANAASAVSVYAIDLDGDDDIDVLLASIDDDSVAWYENDGSESFTKHIITTTADGARFVYAIDLDGDGDIDVLSASMKDNIVAWYENDGIQVFTKHIITTTAYGVRCVYAIDVDGDGDIDVLSASRDDDTIAWYENDGSQRFTKYIITTTTSAAYSVYAIDVDGDSDIDVLSASDFDGTVAWYENDGAQSFVKHIITTNAEGSWSVYAIDLDRDGDIDVLSVSSDDNRGDFDEVLWYENDGNQEFTERIISTTVDDARSVFAIDVDGDDDIDVLSASSSDNTVAWYENLMPVLTSKPTPTPAATPTNEPTYEPTNRPTIPPTPKPTKNPTSNPTYKPTISPTTTPTYIPTPDPTSKLTAYPTPKPTSIPTAEPTSKPISKPTRKQSLLPTLCQNDPTWYKNEDSSKDCDWVSASLLDRCDVRGEDGREASEACSNACGCQYPTREPALSPTARPTLDPKQNPMASPTSSKCTNGIRDGTETDTDCGGSECNACASGFSCGIDSDCSTEVCLAGICVAAPTQRATSQPTHEPTLQPTQQPTFFPTTSKGASPGKRDFTFVIAGATVVSIIIFLLVLFLCCYRKRKKESPPKEAIRTRPDDDNDDDDTPPTRSSESAAAARANARVMVNALLTGASMLPGVYNVSSAILAILDEVDAMNTKAQDIVTAGQRVCHTAEFLTILNENTTSFESDNARLLVERHMQVLENLLKRFQNAVASFGEKGWLCRKWYSIAHNTLLQYIDKEIIEVLEKLRQAYRLAMDRHVTMLFSKQTYCLEAAMHLQIQLLVSKQNITPEAAADQLANDESILTAVAKRAGVSEQEVSEERLRIREKKLELLKTQEIELDFVEKEPFKIGGQARIHKGQSKGRTVAIKSVPLFGLSENDRQLLKSALATEVGICKRLLSACIVQVYGVITVDSNFFGLVMEYMPGGSLRDRLEDINKYPTIAEKQRLAWCGQIADGLQYLYTMGVEHRDLKCNNVLLDANDDLKLADFGLARCDEFRTHTTNLSMSGSGKLTGTFGFMAPELLRDNIFTEKSDVYSYAMLCFEIVTREWPWRGYSLHQIKHAVVDKNERPELPLNASPFLDNLIKACWNQDPNKRPSFENINKRFLKLFAKSQSISFHSISDSFDSPSFAGKYRYTG